jgi:predicted porin
MKKKVMAVAVAGVLAAPALAFAQASTVQIYGLINVEYGYVNQPNTAAALGRSNLDALNSGASRIGFKGEEKLGGSLSAFFQCETDLRFLGGNDATDGAWCDRNSALGLKGGWGSVYIGTWDSPLKRVSGIVRITNETGWVGTQQMMLSNAGNWNGTFSTRNAHTVNYDTPNWNGFSASVQYTTLQAARGLPANTVPTAKGRQVSVSGQYISGPMAIVAGYSKHDDNRSVSGVAGLDDDAWLIGGSYVWGPLKIGLSYIDAEISTGTVLVPGSTERKSWHLAADWSLGGPHTIRFGYSNAGDRKTSVGGGNDTGAKLIQIGYLHSLSKRTQASFSYGRMDNDTFGTYSLTGNSTNAANGGILPGDNSSVFVMGLTHTF